MTGWHYFHPGILQVIYRLKAAHRTDLPAMEDLVERGENGAIRHEGGATDHYLNTDHCHTANHCLVAQY